MTNSTPLLVIQWVLLAFFLTPLIEMIMAGLGAAWTLLGYAQAPGKFRHLIIQITTVGKEPELVQRTLDSLRSYRLTMSYELWVVVEPGSFTEYAAADRVIVVPSDFVCLPIEKARALEYSRLVRVNLGLDQELVKIILVDDDTLPSKRYIYRAFNGNYDVCQGVTVPNRWYAVGGWRHFLLSHLDNIRTRNCLIYCACTQGITQKPLFVHGEGLCITGRAEGIVTWNRKIVASDDLVFGTNAAHLGMSWGYFYGAIQLISPWSFKESLAQRRRWTWGNFDAIGNREIMPLGAAVFKGIKYAFGFLGVMASTTGAILLGLGYAKVPPQAHRVYWLSLACWFISYGICGFINSGGEPNRASRTRLRYWGFRATQTLVATVLTPVTALTPIFVITYSIFKGRPTKFIMIRKSNAAMNNSRVSRTEFPVLATSEIAVVTQPEYAYAGVPHRKASELETVSASASDVANFAGTGQYARSPAAPMPAAYGAASESRNTRDGLAALAAMAAVQEGRRSPASSRRLLPSEGTGLGARHVRREVPMSWPFDDVLRAGDDPAPGSRRSESSSRHRADFQRPEIWTGGTNNQYGQVRQPNGPEGSWFEPVARESSHARRAWQSPSGSMWDESEEILDESAGRAIWE